MKEGDLMIGTGVGKSVMISLDIFSLFNRIFLYCPNTVFHHLITGLHPITHSRQSFKKTPFKNSKKPFNKEAKFQLFDS